LYKTIEKAIEVLNCFCSNKPKLAVKEITKQTGIEKSCISRILSTLEKHGCVEKTEHPGVYQIGYRVHFWSTSYNMQTNLFTVAMPTMYRLRDACGEEVSLYVLEGYRRLCIARVDSTHEIAKFAPIGQYFPLHAGASGKVLLAFLPEEKKELTLNSLKLKRHTPNTICDKEKLEKDLCAIRQKGYAISLGEREPEAFSVTAPIMDASNFAVASLSVAGPIFRLNESLSKKYVLLVTEAAKEISKRLGFLDIDKQPNQARFQNQTRERNAKNESV